MLTQRITLTPIATATNHLFVITFDSGSLLPLQTTFHIYYPWRLIKFLLSKYIGHHCSKCCQPLLVYEASLYMLVGVLLKMMSVITTTVEEGVAVTSSRSGWKAFDAHDHEVSRKGRCLHQRSGGSPGASWC